MKTVRYPKFICIDKTKEVKLCPKCGAIDFMAEVPPPDYLGINLNPPRVPSHTCALTEEESRVNDKWKNDELKAYKQRLRKNK